MKFSEQVQDEAKTAYTSLIDVVFLLLVFFMCATQFKQVERKLDAFLPDEHGSKLAKAIRCSNHSQFVTIIAISTDDDPSNVRRMQDAGADDFITKPLFTEHIRRVVERWLA